MFKIINQYNRMSYTVDQKLARLAAWCGPRVYHPDGSVMKPENPL